MILVGSVVLCETLEGAGNAPACSGLKAPRTGYSCASYPTGYDSKARQSPLPSSDSSQVPGTCSSFSSGGRALECGVLTSREA